MKSLAPFLLFRRVLTPCRVLTLLLLSGFCPLIASAATAATGAIAGTVSNAGTREFLTHVDVSIEGTNLATFTESDGSFRFASVPAGPNTVVVRYAGLDDMRRAVVVTAGATQTLEFNLTSDVYVMGQFVVAGQVEGQAKALNEQKNSAFMKSIVASDAFGDLVDNNAAELLKSLPGIALNYSGEDATDVLIRGQASVNSSIMMDGNALPSPGNNGAQGRAVNFRSIMVNNIETIEVNRAPTAAQPANSLGGSINVVSKSAFTQKGRRIRVDLGMNINSEVKSLFGKSYQGVNYEGKANFPTFQVNYSETFHDNTEHPIGIAATALFANRYRYNTNYTPSYSYVPALTTGQQVTPSTPAIATGVNYPEASSGFIQRLFSLSIDYKLSDNTTLFARPYYLSGPQNQQIYAINHSLRTFAANQTSGTGTAQIAINGNDASTIASLANAQAGLAPVTAGSSSGSRIQKTTGSEQDTKNQIYNLDVGAKQHLGDLTLNYDAFFGRAADWKQVAPRPYEGTLTYDDINVGFNQSNVNSLGNGTLTQTFGPDYKNIANYGRITWTDDTRYSVDRRRGGKVDATRPFSNFRLPFTVQAGVAYDFQQRDTTGASGVNRLNIGAGPDNVFGNADDVALPLAQFTDQHLRDRWNMRGFGVAPGDWIDNAKLFDYLTAHPEAATLDQVGVVTNRYGNTKQFAEEIDSAYLMSTIKLGKFTLLPGVRFEKTADKGTGYARATVTVPTTLPLDQQAALVEAQYRPVTRKTDYHGYFKNLQGRYNATDNLLFRAAYTENIGRPNFGNLLPGDTINVTALTISRNNPDLQPFYAKNYDVGAEYYFNKNTGNVTAAVFRKEIKNYTSNTSFVLPGGADNGYNGLYEGYTVTSQINVPDTTVTEGYELGYQQALRFLPGILKNLSANGSYTHLRSSPRPGQVAVTGIFPVVYNIGLTYNDRTFRVDLKYNMRKSWLSSINTTNGERTYFQDNDRLDLSVNYRFIQRYTLYFDWRNCLNERDVRFVAGNRLAVYFQAGMSINAGIRADF